MSNPDPSAPLAQRLVEAAQTGIDDNTDLGHDSYEEQLADQARFAVVAVLRELAAKPDGYLRYQEDGGITYTRTLRELADLVERGEAGGE